MGRKSMAALGVVAVISGQRQPPPEELTAAQAAVWRDVMSSRPPDWWTAETLPLLAEYCRCVVEANRLAAMIDGISTKRMSATALGKYEKLSRIRAQNAATLKSLATAMRLTQQSRYGARGAESHARKAGTAKVKPWESSDEAANS